jgi:2-polyprenyl-3-methyl-5-hydroxy-6-metoxy-1,4-benzoquinol methylase
MPLGIIKQANLPSYEAKIIFLKSKLAPFLKKDRLVLDAGCGNNNPLLSKEEVRFLIGCDIDLQALQANISTSHTILADLSWLPFTEEFDLIISIDVLEHIEQPLTFIQQAKLALKEKGVLFLVIPNKNSLFGMGAAIIPLKIKRRLYKLLTGKPLKNEVHYYRLNTVDQLTKILKANGFELVEISMMNYLSSQSWMRFVFFPYFLLCKISILSRFSPNILCLAQKQERPNLKMIMNIDEN